MARRIAVAYPQHEDDRVRFSQQGAPAAATPLCNRGAGAAVMRVRSS